MLLFTVADEGNVLFWKKKELPILCNDSVTVGCGNSSRVTPPSAPSAPPPGGSALSVRFPQVVPAAAGRRNVTGLSVCSGPHFSGTNHGNKTSQLHPEINKCLIQAFRYEEEWEAESREDLCWMFLTVGISWSQSRCGCSHLSLRVSLIVPADYLKFCASGQFEVSELTMPELISVNEFIAETNEDYKAPTTSSFTTRMSHCRNAVAALEEVRGQHTHTRTHAHREINWYEYITSVELIQVLKPLSTIKKSVI